MHNNNNYYYYYLEKKTCFGNITFIIRSHLLKYYLFC